MPDRESNVTAGQTGRLDLDPQILAAARGQLEEFCDRSGIDLSDLIGPQLSKRQRRLRNEATRVARKQTVACYGVLGHLLAEDPVVLQRSVRTALELPHW